VERLKLRDQLFLGCLVSIETLLPINMWLHHTHKGGEILGDKIKIHSLSSHSQHKNPHHTRPIITILTTPFFLGQKKPCTLYLHSASSIVNHNLSSTFPKQNKAQSLSYLKPIKPETICPFHHLFPITIAALLNQANHRFHLHYQAWPSSPTTPSSLWQPIPHCQLPSLSHC